MPDRSSSKRRVVITGIGLVTPVGIGTRPSWEAVLAGESGAGEITLIDHREFPVHFACEVKNFDETKWIDKREARRLDRFVHFAIATTAMAIEDAKLDLSTLDRRRCGVVYGSGIGGILSIEEQYTRFMEKGPSRISPFTIPLLMVNCACGQIAINLGFQGVNYGPVSACASASHAIALSFRHIQWGDADLIVTGGSEAGISNLGLGGFSNMKALSTRNEDPKKASRPFDKDRDGFVMAEGAGTLILEELEHAKRRGAPIYAEVLGCGLTDDAFHITAPSEGGEGAARAMTLAMEEAGIRPEEVDYINAHGTSTPYNDKAETDAIKRALGEAAYKTAVSSTKGSTGHLLGAAGAVELAFLALAIQESILPPTINYETPDPECDLDYVPNVKRKKEVRYGLSNSLGFGGHNATICLGRYEG